MNTITLSTLRFKMDSALQLRADGVIDDAKALEIARGYADGFKEADGTIIEAADLEIAHLLDPESAARLQMEKWAETNREALAEIEAKRKEVLALIEKLPSLPEGVHLPNLPKVKPALSSGKTGKRTKAYEPVVGKLYQPGERASGRGYAIRVRADGRWEAVKLDSSGKVAKILSEHKSHTQAGWAVLETVGHTSNLSIPSHFNLTVKE